MSLCELLDIWTAASKTVSSLHTQNRWKDQASTKDQKTDPVCAALLKVKARIGA